MKKKNRSSGKSRKNSNLKSRSARTRSSSADKKAQAKRAATKREAAIELPRPERVSGVLVSVASLDSRELPKRLPRGAEYKLYQSGRGDGPDIFVPAYDPASGLPAWGDGVKVGVRPDYKTETKICMRHGRYLTVEHYLCGKVEEVFGDPDSFEANYREILYSKGIRTEFPAEVEADALSRAAMPLSEEGRTRPTQIPFTIDGADARDLDDAISVSETEDGFRLGVHIADVSAYVTPESPLMAEAMRRTCSVYFPTEVFPMLPRALSNGACSLGAGEDKYAISVYMEIDSCGRTLSSEIRREIIRSEVRGVYSEVNDIFALGDRSEFAEKYKSVSKSLQTMRRLYGILADAAASRGSIELELPDTVILPATGGGAPEIFPEVRGDAERMIEQFMLCANAAVARYFIERRLPCVFRVHESPDPLRLADLGAFARSVGLKWRASAGIPSCRCAIAAMLAEAGKRDLTDTVSYPILRAMAKAKYSERNLGHFALALPEYCHFTSPIRRISDLAVHTVLSRLLSGEDTRELSSFVRSVSYEATDGEIRASGAEREVRDLWCALWLSEHIGEEFEAKISSVTRFGLFVSLPNTCDGLIPISSLDGYYVFNEDSLSLIREGGGKSYRIGESLRVRLEDVSISSRRASFSVVLSD